MIITFVFQAINLSSKNDLLPSSSSIKVLNGVFMFEMDLIFMNRKPLGQLHPDPRSGYAFRGSLRRYRPTQYWPCAA